MADTGDWGPSGSIQAEQGYAPARPRLTFVDLILQLWRAKWLMMLVGLPIFALGLLLALQMPKTFEASGQFYVTPGQETTATSVGNDAARGGTPELEQVIQGELQLIRSPTVAERTLSRFPLKRIYPELAEARDKAVAAAPQDEEAIDFEFFQKSVDTFRKNMWAGAPPKNPVINVAFKHKDPSTSAEILNASMAAYLSYRSELFSARPIDQLTAQRRRFEADLLKADDVISAFLRRNDIGDYGSERSTAQGLYSTISAELFGVKSRASAVDGQLARTRSQLAATPPEQDLFIEDSSDQTLMNLKLEREELLGRYREGSQAVQAIDKRIAQVESLLGNKDGASGLVRRGPNPTYQALEGTLNNLEAEAESLAGQRIELERQLNQVDDTLKKFTRLDPEWSELQRNRDLLEQNVRLLSSAEQSEGTIKQIAQDGTDSVKITSEARAPLEGSSLRMPVAVLSLLFAGFTALMVGLLRALTREGFASPRSLQRTTGLPVLTAIGRRS